MLWIELEMLIVLRKCPLGNACSMAASLRSSPQLHRAPSPDTLSTDEISLQTRCFAVGAFDIRVTSDCLFATRRYPND
jgi:hypothetical protein